MGSVEFSRVRVQIVDCDFPMQVTQGNPAAESGWGVDACLGREGGPPGGLQGRAYRVSTVQFPQGGDPRRRDKVEGGRHAGSGHREEGDVQSGLEATRTQEVGGDRAPATDLCEHPAGICFLVARQAQRFPRPSRVASGERHLAQVTTPFAP